MDSGSERVFSPGERSRDCPAAPAPGSPAQAGGPAVAGPLAEPPWETRSCPWPQAPQPARTEQRPGGQPGSAEAGGQRERGPEAAGPPRYLHSYSRGSPCSKKKGRRGEWNRRQHQRYRRGDATHAGGPARRPGRTATGGRGPDRVRARLRAAARPQLRTAEPPRAATSAPCVQKGPPGAAVCRVARLLCENRWLWDMMYFLNTLVTSWLTCFCRSCVSESFASMVHVRLYSLLQNQNSMENEK